MFYNWREADDLTVDQMEAADFADRINDMVAQGDAWANVEEAIEEFVGLSLYTWEEGKALYVKGQEVLTRYAIFHGGRTTIPYMIDRTPSDNKITNAAAWFLVDAGFIAHSPAYRFVRFYPRKAEAAI